MVTLFSYKINRCIITNTISICAPGKILSEDEYSITLSTIDFNIILYKNKFSEFIDECRNNNINVVKRIFDSIYLEEKTIEEWTPLIVDCYNNSIESAAFLLKMEADANAFNKNGTTVLMYAKDAILKHNQYDILVLILKYKPNIYISKIFMEEIYFII